MAQHGIIKLFEENKIRVFFDDVEEKWYFCINDVIQALTESKDPADYFKKMRKRDAELNEFVQGTNCPPPPPTNLPLRMVNCTQSIVPRGYRTAIGAFGHQFRKGH